MVSSATPPCRSIIHTVAVGDLRQQRSDRKSASPHARCAHLRVGSGLAVVAVRPFRRALLLRPEVRPSDLAPSTDHRHAKHRLDVCEVRCDHYIAANRTTSQRTALHSAARTVLQNSEPYYIVVAPYYTVVAPYYTVVAPYYIVVAPYYIVVPPYYIVVALLGQTWSHLHRRHATGQQLALRERGEERYGLRHEAAVVGRA